MWPSGNGVDSSAILHYAAAQAGSRLKTFSVSFSGRSFDETAYIRKIVERYQTEHEQVDMNPNLNLLDAIAEFAYYSDEPSADAGALPVWFSFQTVQEQDNGRAERGGRGRTLCWLSCSSCQLAGRARVEIYPPASFRFALDQLRRLPVSDEKIGLEYKLKRFLEGCVMPAAEAHTSYWNGTFSREQKSRNYWRNRFRRRWTRILNELQHRVQGNDSQGNDLQGNDQLESLLMV